MTTGQLTTTVLALVLAAVLTLGGLMPVLRNGGESSASVPSPSGATAGGTVVTSNDTPVPTTTPRGAAEDGTSTRGGAEQASPVPTAGSAGGGSIDDGQPSDADGGSAGPSAEPSSPPATTTPTPSSPPRGTATVFAPVDMGAPDGLTVTDDGTVWVATGPDDDGVPRLLAYSANGRLERAFVVSGHSAGSSLGLTGLAAMPDGSVLALDASNARVLSFEPADGTQRTLTTVPDIPPCQIVVAAENGCEPGLTDDAPLLQAIAVDRAGTVYITDTAQGTIWRIDGSRGPAEVFVSDTAWGSPDGLGGIAVAADGSLIVASPQPLDPASAGGGAVYRVPISEGRPGSKEMVAQFGPGQGPNGLVVGEDGSTVVTLRDADEIVLFDADGNEVRRIGGSAGERAIDTPAGATFHGSVLLVANRAPESPEDRAVLAVGIG